MNPSNPSAVRLYNLCRRCTACSKNGLRFVHNQHVIIGFFPSPCIANILLIVNGVLLPIHVIWLVTIFRQQGNAIPYHLPNRIANLCLTIGKERCRPFQGQCMHGNTIRIQCQYFFQCPMKALWRIVRQPCNQVHVDVGKANFSCQLKCLCNLCRSMFSTDLLQNSIFHRLWVDRNPVNTIAFQDFQFLPCNGVRSACLYAELPYLRKVKNSHDCLQELFQRFRRNGSWRTTAKINRIHGNL